jgi:NAD(P)-dependent dehydrogenase (short-subunit alcohol dehydrogenase family)
LGYVLTARIFRRVIADLAADALLATAQRIRDAGGIAHTRATDIADGASVATMAAWCLETIGAPDILLNTVIEYPSTFSGIDDFKVADWKRSFDVNVFG